MRFDWDAPKAKANLAKHGVSFEEASTVFYDPFAITNDDLEHSEDEDRSRTIGVSARLRMLVVVHLRPVNDLMRIISARKASRQEAQDYEQEVKDRLARDEQ